MIDTYNFYCSEIYFDTVISKIYEYLLQDLKFEVEITGNGNQKIMYCRNHECEGVIRLEQMSPQNSIEYYQLGIPRFVVNWDGYKINETSERVTSYIDKLSKMFSPEEEKKLSEYTPVLEKLVSKKLFDEKILSNTILILREHSLISVFNMLNILVKMGLKPKNTVYYSKGDMCKNIYRIEESLRNKGYTVCTLSPFESTSQTGRTEDEKILPKAEKRVYKELKPFFERAKKENKKVIVFDDGGLLITTVIDLFLEKYCDNIYGFIETTKGGMYAIKSRKDIKATVLNLAGCEIKELMSPVIAHSIVHRLKEIIPHVGLQNKNVVVIGYGSLGKTVAQDLRNQGMSVYICDINDTRAYEALAAGYPVSKNAKYLFKEFNPLLIMGCTGMDALTYESLSVLTTDTYVATVSSNEIKQSYSKFDAACQLNVIENYARIYKLPKGNSLFILGNGASLNLFNGEGAVHADYQPFLASMIECIGYCAEKGPLRGYDGLNTALTDKINNNANILGKYLQLTKSLLG